MSAVSAVPEMGRRERRKLEVRARILTAAVELFGNDGPEKVTIAQICERADVAQKTFFNYFASRQELLRAIVEASMENLQADVREIGELPGPTRARLLRFFDRIVDNLEQTGPGYRGLLAEAIHATHEAGAADAQSQRQAVLGATFELLLREGRSAGDVSRKQPLETQADLILGSFYVLIFNWAYVDGYPLRAKARAMAKVLADAVCVSAD